MPGTREGGLKAGATNKKLYGDDFYRKISVQGGAAGTTGGFYKDAVRAKMLGSMGGTKRWEGRLGVQQEELLTYISLHPILVGTGPYPASKNKRLIGTLLNRGMIEQIDDMYYVSKAGQDHLLNHELSSDIIEAPSKSLKVSSDERSVFSFAVWFPFTLTMSLLNFGYVAVHYYLILHTWWA